MEEKEIGTVSHENLVKDDEAVEKAIKEFGYNIYDLREYDYDLPEELIAQTPAKKRDESKLLVLDKNTGEWVDEPYFKNLLKYLKPGDVIVRNNTKVIPARLFGIKEETKAKVEVLLLRQLKEEGADIWECLVGNAKAVKLGTVIDFGEGKLKAICTEVLDEGLRHFRFEYKGIFMEVLDELGKMPLPPYIKSQVAPNDRYQTVYARQHHMHSEWFTMSQEVADKLNKAKEEGRRIIAVGTTSIRTLETVAHLNNGKFKGMSGDTALFIYPGFKWMAVDAFVTNFHLPKSTLVMLVSSFAGREHVLNAYKHAVEEKYRFFSFGDAMFIHE